MCPDQGHFPRSVVPERKEPRCPMSGCLIFRSAVDNEVLPACEADVLERDRRPISGRGRLRASGTVPQLGGEDRLGGVPAILGGEAPAPNPNSGEACTLRSRQRSSARSVTVPVLYLMLTSFGGVPD